MTNRTPTPASDSEVLVARRYLQNGFLDAAMRLFARNVARVEARDWTELANRLMERQRVADAVQICELGGIPLPTDRLLLLGDAHLRRKDFDNAIHYYELADADSERWGRVVDALTRVPEQELRAIGIAERHLMSDRPGSLRIAVAS